jgi:mRNA-degrading endonuclease HigB of HigAB toxin-antitoxin module
MLTEILNTVTEAQYEHISKIKNISSKDEKYLKDNVYIVLI